MISDKAKERLRSLVGIAPKRAARDEALRAEFLWMVLGIATIALIADSPLDWARFGGKNPLSQATARWLTLEFAAGLVVAYILLWRRHVSSSAIVMLVLSSHAAAFAMKVHGVSSPAGALLLITIVLCGLLVGGWFLLTWTLICVGIVYWLAFKESQDGTPFSAVRLGFWRDTIILTAILVSAMARKLERAHALVRGQAAAMSRILGLTISQPRTKDALPAAVDAVRQELGADDAYVAYVGKQLPELGPNALRVRLARGTQPLGDVAFTRRSGDRFSTDEVELAESLTQPVAVALLLADLSEIEREAAVLEERNRIGREIHDSLAQGFTGVILQCQAAAAALPADVEAARAHLDRARDLARASLEEARRSVWALRPSAIGREGLAAAVERLAREITSGTGIAVRAEMEGAIVTLPEAVDEELRGVAREAIVNAVRHAAPREIRTSVRYGAASVTLEIGDDGSGARAAGVAEAPGFGSTSLRERVSKIGGKLSVDSRPGEGTRVRVDVPLPA